MRAFILSLLALMMSIASAQSTTFEVGKGAFLLDGKPFVVKAAELHYPRIPRSYWEHRIEMCKALGMNTICLYVFWNFHEERPDEYNFTGQADLAEFCRLCQKHGMYVILRPGPYVCAEWEMGGLPWWLLKKSDIRLREDDPYFLDRVERFEAQVAAQVAHLTVQRGGPIIMVQVENEYGSYGTDKPYVRAIRDIIRRHFGSDVTLFQCDWASNFTENGLDDLVWTMNFGTGADIDQQFARLKELRPDSPLMCSEFWSGWFDKWGANHETRSADAMIAGIDAMLSKGISFSLYMTHGGTNWGHWAGANSPGYAPDVTSYDYDAPISESGQATAKYHLLRSIMAKYSPSQELPPIPSPIETIEIVPIRFTEVAPLLTNLPEAKADSVIRSMEYYDQGFGSILYRTALPQIDSTSKLTISDVHDYARVMVDGELVGCLDRRNGEREIFIPACRKGARLDILVEAMGRINFGRAIKDYKGITDSVVVSVDGKNHRLTDWQVFNIEDDYDTYAKMDFVPVDSLSDNVRGCYRATFRLDRVGDTFLNVESWGKGLVYVNGRGIGRFWHIGPQQTLYVPGCWLHEGENEILVFDIVGPREAVTEGLSHPIIDKLNLTSAIRRVHFELGDIEPVYVGQFKSGNGWQEVTFDTPAVGRYLCIEALSAHDESSQVAVAELYLLDDQGERIPRESWTVEYVDSEDVGQNHTAEKAFDLQESTYWLSASSAPYPHRLVIDLGAERTMRALQYLPRMETSAPGSIKDTKIYVY